MKIKTMLQTSWLNTVRLNIYYFGLKGLKLPVLISKNIRIVELKGKVEIDCPIKSGMIKIGYGEVGIVDFKFDKGCWENKGKITFAGVADIGKGSKICCGLNGHIKMGNNFLVTAKTTIIAFHKVFIGNDVVLSWNNFIMDTDFHKIYDYTGTMINQDEPIFISNHVWIGMDCTILKGADIPENTVIGAGSLITKKLGAGNAVYASHNRLIRDQIKWEG